MPSGDIRTLRLRDRRLAIGARTYVMAIVNLTDDSEKPLGEWNRMVIECVGDEVKVWVNGDLVNHGSDCTASKGRIALQAEGAEVEFRKLELTDITSLSETSP